MNKKLHRILIAMMIVVAMVFASMSAFAATPLKITKQPVSVTVSSGTTAKVDVDATGEGLTYKWYYKNKGDKKFSYTKSFKGDKYSVKMNSSRAGRQVYCVIKDKSGNSVKTKTATLHKGTTLKVSTQPKSVTVKKGATAKVTFSAKGSGLKYKWYYKNAGDKKFSRTTSFKGTSYSVKMNSDRDGRQVYCVITDKYGSSIKTKTVTIAQMKTAKVTKQPASVSVGYGETATVSFTASGDGLTYKWYYKNSGSSSYSSTSSFKGNTYSVEMNKERAGRQIYCKVTDKYGNSVKTNSVSLNMTSVYFITVSDGTDKYIVGVDKSGKYSLTKPTKNGYVFMGWKTSGGADFANSGTISEDVKINAVWEIAETKTLSQLMERINSGVKEIKITQNITINQPIYVTKEVNIFADGEYALKRSESYNGDMFVVGQNSKGVSAAELGGKPIMTLGGGKGTLIIDGNKSNMLVDVAGSAIYTIDSGKVNIKEGAKIAHHKKVANKRVHNLSNTISPTTLDTIGGAAITIMNGSVNMYGGSIEDCEVKTATTTVSGTAKEISTAGGAVYNRGTFSMYGGTIEGSKGYFGGAVYNDEHINLVAGTISNSTATTYGGGVATSGSVTSQTFLGSDDESKGTMTIIGSNAGVSGGAIYSYTSSPIVIAGNTVIENNTAVNYGGAIYTAGGLTIYDTEFRNNNAAQGGAIAHRYANPDLNRRLVKIENSLFEGNKGDYYGGAIALNASDTVPTGTYALITGTDFVNNQSISSDGKYGEGGAVYVTKKSEATIKDCTFTGNEAAANAGAVMAHGNSTVYISKSDFGENKAANGGALYIADGSALSVADGKMNKNSATYGGAIFSNPAVLSVSGIAFEENNAAASGGAVIIQGTELKVTGDTVFRKNTSEGRGGAVDITKYGDIYGKFDATDVVFEENSAAGNGGAINVVEGSTLALSGCELNDNKAGVSASGGAICTYPATVTVESTKFDGNTAGYGGAISTSGAEVKVTGDSSFTNNVAGTRGGAVDVTKSNTTYGKLDATGAVFEGNTTEGNGGAVYLAKGTSASLTNGEMSSNKSGTEASGGAIFAYTSKINIDNINFDGNEAGYGGAISSNGATVTITGNSEFTDNVASVRGGAIDGTHLDSIDFTNLKVTGGKFANNSAGTGGAVYLRTGCEGSFSGTEFTGNASVVNNDANSKEVGGGAIYAHTDCKVTLSGVNMNKNSSTNYGGTVMINSGTLTIDGNSSITEASGRTGVAVYAYNCKTVTIEDTDISKNIAVYNGAVYNNAGTMTVKNVTANENEANQGAAFYLSAGTNILTNVTATGNTTSGQAGAIYVGSGNATINISNISNNNASAKGGAVSMVDGTTTINDSTLNNNTSTKAGGAVSMDAGKLVVNKTAINNNTGVNGGAIHVAAGTLEVTGGEMNSNKGGSGASGGAILAYPSTVTIKDTEFDGNSAGYGGAISSNGADVKISGTAEFKNNSAGTRGGAVDLTKYTANSNTTYGKLDATDTVFEGNTTDGNGGAIYIVEGTSATFTGGAMNDNKAGANASGGAIFAYPTTVTIKDTEFDGNSAGYGGAISSNGADVKISGKAEFKNNSAGTRGGAVDLTKSGTTLGTLESTGAIFEGNTTSGNGGAIYMANGTSATFTGGEMNSNSTNASGGAIFAYPATITVKGTKFNENRAGYGGAISSNGSVIEVSEDAEFTNNTAVTRGGAIDGTIDGSNVTKLTVTGGKFVGNGAGTGGAVYLRTGSEATLEGTVVSNNESNDTNTSNNKEIGGGAFYAHTNCKLNLKGVEMDGNKSAVYGGAVHVYGGTLTMNGQSSITNSKAGTHGAAMYLYTANSEVKDSVISNNEATWQGTIYIANTGTHTFENITANNNKANQGGVFCLCDQPTVTLKSVNASGNTAKAEGGVIYQYAWGGKLDITDCEFDTNTAATKGGALWAGAKGQITVSGGKFANNTAPNGGAMYLDNTMFGTNNPSAARAIVKDNTLFESNTATTGEGGAIYIADTTSEGTAATTLTMSDATLKDNKAYNKGGAIATDVTSPNLVINCTACAFISNQSGYNNPSTSYPGGGAVEIQNGNGYANGEPTTLNIVFTDCTFTDNLGAGTGGAVDIRSCSYVKFDGLTATGNKSVKKWNGAVIYLTSEGSRLYMTGDVVSSNNTAGSYDTFAYVNNAKAWVYTTHSSTADWVTKTYSLSAINFDQPTLP